MCLISSHGSSAYNKISNFFLENKKLIFGVAVVYGVTKLLKYKKRQNLRNEWNNAGLNVVVVHTLPASTSSPDTVKLLTYLRMAGIQYKLDTTTPFGPKGGFPWITLNAEDFCDSQHIIEHLNMVFEKNFSYKLSPEEKAVARAFRIMTEEYLHWGLALWRFVEDEGIGFMSYYRRHFMSNCLIILITRTSVQQAAYGQGMGGHSTDEVHRIMIQTLANLSHYLGKKSFLMGEEPCEEDCAVFGFLSQLKQQSQGSPYTKALEGNFQNLDEYCDRMKSKYWPDWIGYTVLI